MTTFKIEIEDRVLLAGIAAARAEHNSQLPNEMIVVQHKDGETIRARTMEEKTLYFDSDEPFLRWVVQNFALSMARQHQTTDEGIAAMEAKLAAVRAQRGA